VLFPALANGPVILELPSNRDIQRRVFVRSIETIGNCDRNPARSATSSTDGARGSPRNKNAHRSGPQSVTGTRIDSDAPFPTTSTTAPSARPPNALSRSTPKCQPGCGRGSSWDNGLSSTVSPMSPANPPMVAPISFGDCAAPRRRPQPSQNSSGNRVLEAGT